MKIRKAAEQDQGAWLSLRKALWPDCPEDRHALEISQTLSAPGVVLLAEVDGCGVVGFAEVSIRQDHVEGATQSPIPYLEGWYVAPEQRKRGIGKSLLQHVFEWARYNGYSEVASDVEPHNDLSLNAHLKHGFQETGRSINLIARLDTPPGPRHPAL